MNKPNGIKDQATLSQKEQKSRHCSSALPTFLKWFKKDSKYSNNRETLSSTQSTISTKSLGKFSPSSSCDSIISTSTTGFAYIKPSNYKPDGITNERKLILDNGFETNILTNHMKNYREENNLTLRTKYHLYDADTLKSNNASFLEFNNTKYFDGSLPNVKNQQTNERKNNRIRRHRRTVSDSSKEKRSGAYVHVKGKRKAPQPPIICAENQNCNKILKSLSSTCQVLNTKNTETLSSSGSTLNKKKRRAPPPPPLTIPKSDVNDNDKLASTSENFFSENDIKAILGRSISIDSKENSSPNSNSKMVDEITNYKSKLTDLQKQTVIEKVVQAQSSKTNEAVSILNDSKLNSPISPISPKPWYKRPISYNRESSIPFKREVVLKTMEKRKQKHKEKESISIGNALPEVGYTRSSIFDSGNKFGFFLRHKDHSNDSKSKDKEKRRSGIGIPNISELDREAAAIISEEQKAQSKIKDEKYFKTSDQVILQQQMFAPKINNINNLEKSLENNEENVISTKDLISKFELDSNMSKVSLNTSFIGRSDLFSNNQITSKTSAISETTNSSIITNNLTKDNNDENKNDKLERIEEKKFDFINNDLKDDDNSMPKLSWTCPVCTLENPSWRIMCEVCEKLRPFEKFGNFETKINENETKMENSIEKIHDNVQNSNENKSIIQNNSTNKNYEWDKKTEKVMKYFKPRNSNNNALSKSSSESIVGKKYPNQFNRKSSSPSKLPIGSPKFNLKNKSSHNNVSNLICNEILENIHNSDTNISLIHDDIKQPLIDSSAIISTVTPVFYANKNIEENNDRKINDENHSNLDLKEIRNVRILKFTPKQNNIINQSIEKDELLNDPNFLEMEKKRLREKIRAMNAKALTEKYPVLQKTVSVESNNSTLSDKEQQDTLPSSSSSSLSNHQQEEPKNDVSQGAIKKIPQNRVIIDNNQTASNNSGLFSQTATNYDYAVIKPKKVSASAQTSNVIKKDSEIESKTNGSSINATKNEISINKFEKSRKEVSKIENSLKSNNQIKLIETQKSKITEKLNENDKNNLKSSKRYFTKDTNHTDTLALTKIMKNLELAISEGNDELAAQIAMDLAKMKVSLQVTKSSKRNQKIENENDENLKINVMIEDKTYKKKLIQFDVKLQMTILELKQKVLKILNIPIEEQKWYINDKIANDDKKTLIQYNVQNNSVKFDLKLMNNIQTSKLIPTKAICEEIDDLSDNDDDGDNDDSLSATDKKLKTNENHGAIALPPKTSNNTWECPLCTLINSFNCETCSACSKARPQYIQNNKIDNNELSLHQNDKLSKNLSVVDVLKKRIPENKNDLNKSNLNRKSTEIFNIIDDTIQSLNNVLNVSTTLINDNNHQDKIAFHFSSPNITKSKYRGVDNFNPNRISFDQQTVIASSTSSPPIPTSSSTTTVMTTKEIEKSTIIENQQKQLISTTKTTKPIENKHYLELLDLENSDIVVNLDNFECPICFLEYEPGEGVILRDCLHTFCKDCLKNTIQYSDDAEVKCPYIDIEYSCTSVLQEREIKAIVNKDIYELHLAKSVRFAEHQIENTFHCKTPNCRSWCIYEDNVNQFKCPVCRITNCLTCRVIHDGLSCKQYQDRLNSDCDSNIEARRTKDMLKEMVEKGEAMNCPTCQVVLMKKWGCDWLKCSMCKTEICWVTRGPRWGPAGKGDTSAGCKCGVEGKKCHPKCNYCH